MGGQGTCQSRKQGEKKKFFFARVDFTFKLVKKRGKEETALRKKDMGQGALKACDFSSLVEAKQREHFPGTREWLFNEVENWLNSNDRTKRVFWLVGGGGTGKSVVSAQLMARKNVRERVMAWHFCRYEKAAENDVRVILQSLAAMLTKTLPGFRVQDLGKARKASTVAEMFDLLLVGPLKRTVNASPCVLLLDALDELPRDSLEAVLQLIADRCGELPSFVKLFLTVN